MTIGRTKGRSYAGRAAAWLLSGMLLLMSILSFSHPASAILNGAIDTAHTYVGVFIGEGTNFVDPSFPFRLCSGTLIAPRVFLTAGHCRHLGVELDRLWVSFATNFLEDRKSWRRVSAVIPHPDFDEHEPPYSEHDIEVVILEKPVKDIVPGRLAPLGLLDTLDAAGLLKDATFSILGYGRIEDLALTGDRRIGFVGFKSLHDEALALSMNLAQGEGVICFSDSGGPALLEVGGTEYVVGSNAVNGGSAFECVGGFADETRVDSVSAQTFLLRAIAANQ